MLICLLYEELHLLLSFLLPLGYGGSIVVYLVYNLEASVHAWGVP